MVKGTQPKQLIYCGATLKLGPIFIRIGWKTDSEIYLNGGQEGNPPGKEGYSQGIGACGNLQGQGVPKGSRLPKNFTCGGALTNFPFFGQGFLFPGVAKSSLFEEHRGNSAGN